MKQNKLFSKYQCDNKLKIYNKDPFNKLEYQKMINNARPRYMNDYFNNPIFNGEKNQKHFDSLLNNYYNDFKNIKNQFTFTENEQNPEEYEEDSNNNNYNYEEFQRKKSNLHTLFLSNDMTEREEIKFDLTDSLINCLYNGKNESLLKNTQTNNDYNLRLKYEKKFPKFNNYIELNSYDENNIQIRNENTEKNEPENEEKNEGESDELYKKEKVFIEDNNIEDDEVYYLDYSNQEIKDENYLKLKFKNNKSDNLQKFEDIINSDYNKEIELPLYDIPKSKSNRDEKKEKIDLDGYYDYLRNKSDNEEEGKNEKILKNEENKENEDNQENEENQENEDKEYILKLINNKNINTKDNKLISFENVISNDFEGNYKIPTYKIPIFIQKEIKEEEQKKKEQAKEYDDNKNQNIINSDSNRNIQMLDKIIKEKEEQKLEDIINSNQKVVYNPPGDRLNNTNKDKINDLRYSENEDGGFETVTNIRDGNQIKNNRVENIINSNNKDNYDSIANYKEFKEDKEGLNNFNYNTEDKKDEYKFNEDNENEIINKNYFEDKIIEPKEENQNNKKENNNVSNSEQIITYDENYEILD